MLCARETLGFGLFNSIDSFQSSVNDLWLCKRNGD